MREDTGDFRRVFLSGAPMMDVRAPLEFARGAFPGAVNLPLMNDEERHLVGLCYAEEGQQAAIELGHRLVSGDLKAARIAEWAGFARAHPDGYLYCFRGGMRSQIVQQWLRDEAGIDYPRVVGGYKAMRGFLMDVTADAAATKDFLVLGGLTGTGKTDVIAELPAAVDLEGLARHRGSAFGRRAQAQPPQIGFENALAIDLLRRADAGYHALVVEDEGRFIGGRDLPKALWQRMQASPLVWLEASFEERVERVLRDYVLGLASEHIDRFGPSAGFDAYAARLRDAMAAIAPRLGGERYARLSALLEQALSSQAERGETGLHRGWIEVLLRDYYDPMYAYQQQSRAARIVFRGDRAAVAAWLRERSAR
ncbi:tRNA 2-selenouridine synthase [Cupriavidus laharis]|uniref:tRNA 2-selenouridine synthase n=1 Tax=Cupriavidus laharis TaxID=151654 RepID=A0ABM8XE62_9BURK|nr:tRNA 2-selenouridine(34) synthase MnmH [Cupriavidus laharis]CAG9178363.1 tRNA 2-selenouridine synthase [Cupriavidus laharis]